MPVYVGLLEQIVVILPQFLTYPSSLTAALGLNCCSYWRLHNDTGMQKLVTQLAVPLHRIISDRLLNQTMHTCLKFLPLTTSTLLKLLQLVNNPAHNNIVQINNWPLSWLCSCIWWIIEPNHASLASMQPLRSTNQSSFAEAAADGED